MRTYLYLGLLVIPILLISCDKNKNSLTNSKPNIIIILADDMSYYDLSGLGQTHFLTPNIDALLSEGLFFSEAYAGSSECAPSRASLLTGKHMGNCRIRRNASVRGQEYLIDSDTTIAEMLKLAGYATGMVGKWGVGLSGTEGVPNKQGFDYSCGFYDQSRAHTYYPYFLMENEKVIPLPENYGFDMEQTYAHNRDSIGLHTYNEKGELEPLGVSNPSKVVNSQNYIHQKAISFITENYQKPFFLYYATQLPHGPVITPDLGDYKDKPWSQKHKEWAAMMDHLDQCVGEISETIEELGIAENTIIFFASDNGYSQWGYFNRKRYTDDPLFKNKGPWKGGKFTPLDGGVRVPFFATFPGKIKSGISNEVVSLYDLMATACELAGVDQPTNDGKSLIPLLENKRLTSPLHEYLYWENGSFSNHAQSTRFRNWFAFREHPTKPVQLWDILRDTSCLYDIASTNKLIVNEAISIFKKEHTHSEWYINPEETQKDAEVKYQRAKNENSLQHSVKGNTKYPLE